MSFSLLISHVSCYLIPLFTPCALCPWPGGHQGLAGVRTPGTAPFPVPTPAIPASCCGGRNTGSGRVSTYQSKKWLNRVLPHRGTSTGI